MRSTAKTVKVREITDLVTKGTTPTSIGRSFTADGVRFLKVETFSPNGNYIPGKEAFIDAHTHAILRRSQLQAGDILFSIAGALGRSTVVEEHWLPANTNQAISIVRTSKRSGVNPRYLLWSLRSDHIKSRIAEISVQAAQANLSLEQVRDFEISLLPRHQQDAIVRRLDAVDALQDSLECLIAKKQAIKQGMMQQILTGKTRLPGFDAPWVSTVIGSLGSLLKGRGVKRDDVRPSGVPCIRYGELYTTFRDYTDVTVSFVSKDIAATALPISEGDLLFAGSGETKAEIGTCVAYTGRSAAVAGGDIIVLRAPKMNAIFLASLLNAPEVAAMKASSGQGDAVVHINARAIAALHVDLPEKSEQDAIARVIVDADKELEALVARLVAVRNIKQGMMQELLTGHTRLVPAEVSA